MQQYERDPLILVDKVPNFRNWFLRVLKMLTELLGTIIIIILIII